MPDESLIDEAAYLRAVKARLARLFHDLNNPLAIASGNLQFVAELARMGETENLGEAVADTSEAIRRMEALMQGFLEVRSDIERRLAQLDESV